MDPHKKLQEQKKRKILKRKEKRELKRGTKKPRLDEGVAKPRSPDWILKGLTIGKQVWTSDKVKIQMKVFSLKTPPQFEFRVDDKEQSSKIRVVVRNYSLFCFDSYCFPSQVKRRRDC